MISFLYEGNLVGIDYIVAISKTRNDGKQEEVTVETSNSTSAQEGAQR